MEENNYGAIPSQLDLRDYRVSSEVTKLDIPEEYEIHHSKIKNQNPIGSCVAHSVSEILEASNGINYSTGWIYGYRPESYKSQGRGMIVAEALKTVNKIGAVENSAFNYNVEMPQAKFIVDENLDTLIELAKDMKIIYYAKMFSNNEIKQAIMSDGLPVLLVIPIDAKGLKVDKSGVAYLPNDINSYHAIVCYGWNKSGFLIQNSWGSVWGNKGCFILPYEYEITESWMLTPDSNKVQKPEMYFIRKILQSLINMLIKLLG